MRARSKKIVSLFDFVKTGRLDGVALGWTKEEVLTKFCKPDDRYDMEHNISIWKYSTFELHFAEDKLFLLWCDNLAYLRNPLKKQFKFDKWIFKDLKRLTFSYFCSKLDDLGIMYTAKGVFYNGGNSLPTSVMLFIEGTDIVVYFEDNEEQETTVDKYNIVAIGASTMHQQNNVRDL